MTYGISNRRRNVMMYMPLEPSIRRIGTCDIDEPIMIRAEGTVMLPRSVKIWQTGFGTLIANTTMIIERYDAISPGE